MSENRQVEPDLEAAIAENPAAVAEFVRRLDTDNELRAVLDPDESAPTDAVSHDRADATSTLAESADGLATEQTVGLAETIGENGAELEAALDSIVALQRSGTLDELIEFAEVVSLVSAALDDEMVTSLAATGSSIGEIAETAAEDDVRNGLETALQGVADAEAEATEAVGVRELVGAARDPEVKRGLGYLLSLARAIGEAQTPPEAQ